MRELLERKGLMMPTVGQTVYLLMGEAIQPRKFVKEVDISGQLNYSTTNRWGQFCIEPAGYFYLSKILAMKQKVRVMKRKVNCRESQIANLQQSLNLYKEEVASLEEFIAKYER